MKIHYTDVLVIGGGLAGLVTTYECLQAGKRVTLVDRDSRERLGGLHSARLLLWSFDFAEIAQLQHAGDWDGAAARLGEVARRQPAARRLEHQIPFHDVQYCRVEDLLRPAVSARSSRRPRTAASRRCGP